MPSLSIGHKIHSAAILDQIDSVSQCHWFQNLITSNCVLKLFFWAVKSAVHWTIHNACLSSKADWPLSCSIKAGCSKRVQNVEWDIFLSLSVALIWRLFRAKYSALFQLIYLFCVKLLSPASLSHRVVFFLSAHLLFAHIFLLHNV